MYVSPNERHNARLAAASLADDELAEAVALLEDGAGVVKLIRSDIARLDTYKEVLAERAAVSGVVGKVFTCHDQPYGTFKMKVTSSGWYNGSVTLEGKVVEGTETSRLFQYTSTQSIVGQVRTVYGVRLHELERMEATRANCG